MSRPSRLDTTAYALGAGLIVFTAYFAHGWVPWPLRYGLGIFGVVLCPGWLVVRRSAPSTEAPLGAIEAIIGTFVTVVVAGFLLSWLSVPLVRNVYVAVLLLVGAVLLLRVERQAPTGPKWRAGALAAAVLMAVSGPASAALTHLSLSPAPVESAFSLTSQPFFYVDAGTNAVILPITVQRINYPHPIVLNVQIDYRTVQKITIPTHASHVNASVSLPANVSCPYFVVSATATGGQQVNRTLPCPTK